MAEKNTNFQYDAPLSAVANTITIGTGVADRVLPTIPVTKSSFKYVELPREEIGRVAETRISPRGIPNEVTFTGRQVSDSVEGHALMSPIDRHMLQEANGAGVTLDPRAQATTGTRDMLELGQEKGMAETVFDPANYEPAQVTALVGANKWDDPTSKPLTAILNDFTEVPMRPNVGIIGDKVAVALQTNPQILKARNGAGAAPADEGVTDLPTVARLLGLSRLIVGTAKINTSTFGAASATFGNLWTNSAAFLYESNLTLFGGGGEIYTVSWGVTFYLPLRGQRYLTSSWLDPKPGLQGTETVKVSTAYAQRVVAKDLGMLYTGVTS